MAISRLYPSLQAVRAAMLLGCVTLVSANAAQADPIRVYAAGSLVAALKDVIAASGLPAEAVAAPTFGPAGLLRQRIENGEKADLYLSADLTGPRHLADVGKARDVVPFARNRLCVLAQADLGLTPDTLLDRLLKPDLRLEAVMDLGGADAQMGRDEPCSQAVSV